MNFDTLALRQSLLPHHVVNITLLTLLFALECSTRQCKCSDAGYTPIRGLYGRLQKLCLIEVGSDTRGGGLPEVPISNFCD